MAITGFLVGSRRLKYSFIIQRGTLTQPPVAPEPLTRRKIPAPDDMRHLGPLGL